MFERLKRQNIDQFCQICGKNEARFIRTLPKGYKLFSCLQCGASFCNPFSAPSQDFYTRAADFASSLRHSGPTKWYHSHPTRDSSVFAKGKKGLLLDVGCGNGAFAEFATSIGYQVIGIDMDAASIQVARSRNLQAEFYCCSIEEFFAAHQYAKKFDIITMFEVFEHLDRPLPIINSVKSLLRDGGLLIGSLPNTERLLMWHINMDYELPPYHLTYWTTKSWSKFLKQHNFSVPCCKPEIYFGYMADVLTNRYKTPAFLQKLISKFVYPVEFKVEKHYKIGASFYFEAKLEGE
jgi:2-polyprenyl-3-methyl-5-hydroxy-6-metoxy-1,4-benzoquinol methylase